MHMKKKHLSIISNLLCFGLGNVANVIIRRKSPTSLEEESNGVPKRSVPCCVVMDLIPSSLVTCLRQFI